MKDIMDWIVIPSSEALFNAVGSTTGPNGVEDKAPKTDADWAEVRQKAVLLAEAGNLLILSQESGRIVEVTRDGTIVSQLQLTAPATSSGIDLAASYLIGDRLRDIKAGRTAGCHTIFIDYGFKQDEAVEPDAIVKSLPEAVAYILARA